MYFSDGSHGLCSGQNNMKKAMEDLALWGGHAHLQPEPVLWKTSFCGPSSKVGLLEGTRPPPPCRLNFSTDEDHGKDYSQMHPSPGEHDAGPPSVRFLSQN